MTVNGRFVAGAVMILSAGALITLGIIGAVSNRVTGHEVLGGFCALLVAVIAGLWLRRDKRLHDGGQS